MVIVSKFDGKCKVCEGPTYRGDKVVWIKGQRGVSHVACHATGRPQRVVQVAVAEPVEAPLTAVERLEAQVRELKAEEVAEGVREPEPVKAEPEVLKDPRNPNELCAFLTSLSPEQLHALRDIVVGEIERRAGLEKDAA